MGGESPIESWFSSLWRTSRGGNASRRRDKAVVGILAFEVAGLMSKIASLWNCLSDRQIAQLRDEIVSSPGIMRFVSDDEYLLMELAFSEIMDNLVSVARPVVGLGRKCLDPVYHTLEQIFSNPDDNMAERSRGWDYKRKEMEKKVKKMEKFVAYASQLYQEMEVLVELEHTLRRMQTSPDMSQVKLLEFQQKVIWQRNEVKNLQQLSPWNCNFDYVVELLVRSLFTIFERLKFVCRVNFKSPGDGRSVFLVGQEAPDSLSRTRSLVHSSVHPSENHASIFYSGPLTSSSSRLGATFGYKIAGRKSRPAYQHTSEPNKRASLLKTKRLANAGPFKGCMLGGKESPVVQNCIMASNGSSVSPVHCLGGMDGKSGTISGRHSCSSTVHGKASIFSSRSMFSNPPPGTLGEAALSLHYANVIILIEKLASAPHLIAPDARDELYSLLPTCIKTSLRTKLKSYSKNLTSPLYDPALAADWSMAMTRILEWLCPLAHNMVRWQSEQSHEKQHMLPRASVLLVQTLYFANQVKIEAAITELLMGLNYLSRFSKEVNEKAMLSSSDSGAFDGCVIQGGAITCNA